MGKAQDVIDAPLAQPALLDQVGFIIAKQCRADGLRFRHGWRGCNTEIDEMLCELTRESRELDCSVSAGLHLSRQSLARSAVSEHGAMPSASMIRPRHRMRAR